MNIPTKFRMIMPAGSASPGPPIGPQISQRGLNIGQFVKEFNEKSSHLKKGLPTNVMIYQEGRNFRMEIISPVTSGLILSAAGIAKGSDSANKIVGEITLKQVYEIAKVKQNDPFLMFHDLRDICIKVIKQARSMGINIQPHENAIENNESRKRNIFKKYFICCDFKNN